MIGDETDGTVIPQDLGLDWAISKKKADFLGKRGMERTHMTDPNRWKLVGLETLDGSVLPDGAYLTQATQAGKGLVLQGRAQSNARVSTFMRNVDSSPWLNQPKLGIIENKDADKPTAKDNTFQLGLVQVVPKGEAPK